MTKRCIDVAAGAVLAVLSLPLVLVMAVVSALLFRAWPFFTQTRVGLNGRNFRIVKIRTLPKTAPSQAHKFVINEIRLPRFASLLRNTHLDELPQLWLVPVGTMSLVGPRPEMCFLHEQGDDGFGELRTSVRPGCTGLWQVSKAASGLIWDTMEYDRFYVRHACLRLDLWILARTLLIMTPFAKVVSLADIPRWALTFEGRAAVAARSGVPVQPSETDRVIDLRDPLSRGRVADERRPAVIDLQAVTDVPSS
jgi:lipopolysaccharide/colanic/teichoic acid biosynthesis glycosyltransferase